jgi:uncharacterized protein YegJ (DUF2314 family)
MKGNLQTISLLALVGTLMMPVLTVDGKAANVVGQEIAKGGAGSTYYQVPSDHAAMRRAVHEARRTVKKFIVALRHPAPGQTDFEVKKPFIQGNEVEHIWLSDVQFVGNRFQGRVDNQPRKIRGLKLGQLVSVNPDEISDWLYVDNGRLVGGYTVRVHYSELSPEQKQEFDREADFKMEKQ